MPMQSRWIVGKTIASIKRRQVDLTDHCGGVETAIEEIAFTDGSRIRLIAGETGGHEGYEPYVYPVYEPATKPSFGDSRQ